MAATHNDLIGCLPQRHPVCFDPRPKPSVSEIWKTFPLPTKFNLPKRDVANRLVFLCEFVSFLLRLPSEVESLRA